MSSATDRTEHQSVTRSLEFSSIRGRQNGCSQLMGCQAVEPGRNSLCRNILHFVVPHCSYASFNARILLNSDPPNNRSQGRLVLMFANSTSGLVHWTE